MSIDTKDPQALRATAAEWQMKSDRASWDRRPDAAMRAIDIAVALELLANHYDREHETTT